MGFHWGISKSLEDTSHFQSVKIFFLNERVLSQWGVPSEIIRGSYILDKLWNLIFVQSNMLDTTGNVLLSNELLFQIKTRMWKFYLQSQKWCKIGRIFIVILSVNQIILTPHPQYLQPIFSLIWIFHINVTGGCNNHWMQTSHFTGKLLKLESHPEGQCQAGINAGRTPHCPCWLKVRNVHI